VLRGAGEIDTSAYSSVNTLRGTWDLEARGIEARGLSDCVESREQLERVKTLLTVGFRSKRD
jgi:hypothetical protein